MFRDSMIQDYDHENQEHERDLKILWAKAFNGKAEPEVKVSGNLGGPTTLVCDDWKSIGF